MDQVCPNVCTCFNISGFFGSVTLFTFVGLSDRIAVSVSCWEFVLLLIKIGFVIVSFGMNKVFFLYGCSHL